MVFYHQNLIRRALGLTFLILSNANWQSSFQIVGWFFLKRWKIGSHMFINLAMKRLMYYNLPRKPLISFSIFSTSMSSMALILSRSTSMPRSLTICPNNSQKSLQRCTPWGSTSIWIFESFQRIFLKPLGDPLYLRISQSYHPNIPQHPFASCQEIK